MINHVNTEKGKTGGRRVTYPEGLVPRLVTQQCQQCLCPSNADPARGHKGGHTVPGNETQVSDLGAKKHYAVLFSERDRGPGFNNLPAATLPCGKRARIRTHGTKTPNPMLPFLMEPLLNSSKTALKANRHQQAQGGSTFVYPVSFVKNDCTSADSLL